MVDLRVLTWNSTGENAGQGADLVTATNATNAQFAGNVPVQLVATQEASAMGGSIQVALANGPPFNVFIQPQGFIREHPPAPAQPFRVPPNRAYRVSYMATSGTAVNNLAATGPLQLVNLDPATDAGVNNFIQAQGFPPQQRAAVVRAAANMRWPVYQPYLYQGGTVHFFTWHAPLLANWLNAHFSNINLQGPAFPEAFLFFDHSNFFNQILNGLAANDVVIVAGDLNMTQQDIANNLFFPNFVGVTDNLSHILAFNPNAMAVNQGLHFQTNFPPHNILTARVQW